MSFSPSLFVLIASVEDDCSILHAPHEYFHPNNFIISHSLNSATRGPFKGGFRKNGKLLGPPKGG